MKWLLVAGFLVAVARFGNAGALKCSPTSLHPACLDEKGEVSEEASSQEKETEHSEEECLPGSEWESNCHSCLCSSRGVALCSKLSKCETEGEESKPLRCKPGTTFTRDCHACICQDDGVRLCTLTGCVHNSLTSENDTNNGTEGLDHLEMKLHSRVVRGVSSQEPPKMCQPGQEFRLDCNKCLCDNEGKEYSCTRVDCRVNNGNSARRKREVAQQAVTQCEPGAVFDQGCNVCRCASDGHHANCTLKRCSLKPEAKEDNNLPGGDPNFRCNPGEQFKRGCNDCTCSADGKSDFCTLRVCDKDLIPRL